MWSSTTSIWNVYPNLHRSWLNCIDFRSGTLINQLCLRIYFFFFDAIIEGNINMNRNDNCRLHWICQVICSMLSSVMGVTFQKDLWNSGICLKLMVKWWHKLVKILKVFTLEIIKFGIHQKIVFKICKFTSYSLHSLSKNVSNKTLNYMFLK